VTDRGGAVGIGRDRQGWFAAVRLGQHDVLGAPPPPLRLDWLVRLAQDPALPASTLQVVVRQSWPVTGADTATWAGRSYLDLHTGLAAGVRRETWIATRLAVRDASTVAAERGGGQAGVNRALAAVLARIGTGLSDLGVHHDVLDGAQLAASLAACHGDPAAGQPGDEQWSVWQTPAAAHVCFAVRAWPSPAVAAAAVVDPFTALAPVADTAATTAALVLGCRREGRAAPGTVPTRMLVRVEAPPATVRSGARQLCANAAQAGLSLVRLDGEHAAGAYATAPTGAPIGLAPW
jgi:type VII secretion protein EccE